MSDPQEILGARVRTAVMVLGTVSLLATGVAVVFGTQLSAPPAHATDSYTRGPLGHRAFLETATALGIGVTRWNQGHLEEVETPLLIVEPERMTAEMEGSEVDFTALLAARVAAHRPTIIVLPKWLPSLYGPTWVRPGANVTPSSYERALATALTDAGGPLGVERASEPTEVRIDVTVTLSGESSAAVLALQAPQRIHWGTPLVSDAAGNFIALDASRSLMIVSDPDLIHNASFHREDNAVVVLEAITSTFGQDSIAVAEIFHGEVIHPSLGSFLGQWPGVLFLFHLAALALAVLLAARRRFGPPRVTDVPYGHGPRAILDVAASVLVGGTRLGRLSEGFVESALTDAHRALKLTPVATVVDRARALDEAAARRGALPRAVTVLAAAHALRQQRFVRTAEAFSLARSAAHLRRELLAPRKDAA